MIINRLTLAVKIKLRKAKGLTPVSKYSQPVAQVPLLSLQMSIKQMDYKQEAFQLYLFSSDQLNMQYNIF